jgi:hypothetical protein
MTISLMKSFEILDVRSNSIQHKPLLLNESKPLKIYVIICDI